MYGWKAIYKVSLIMLRENEERLRASSFEMVLSQLPLLPYKFIFNEDGQGQELRDKFDKEFRELKVSG